MASSQTYSLKAVLSCVDNLSPTFKKVYKNFKTVDRAFKNVVDSVSDVATKMLAPIGVLAGAGAFSLTNAVTSFTELGDSIDKAAARAGVATGALQKLRIAAELGGATAEDMDDAISELSLKMSEALAGQNEDALTLFTQLGIKLKDTSGQTRNAAVVMRELAEALRINTDNAERLRIVDILLGGDVGKRLIPVLSQGAKGLDDMAQEAERLGIVMSQADIDAAVKFKDTLTLFGRVTDSLSSSIGAKLTPVLGRLVVQIQEAIVANKEVISTRIEQVVKDLAEWVSRIDFGKAIDGAIGFVTSIVDAINAIGGLKTILYVVAGIIGAQFLSNLFSIGTAVIGLTRAVWAFAGPWGLIAVAVAQVAYAIYNNFDTIKAAISEVINWCTKLAEDLGNQFVGAFDNAAMKVKSIWEGVKEFFSGIFKSIGERLSPITNFFSGIFGGPDVGTSGIGAGSAVRTPTVVDQRMNGELVVRVESTDGTRAQVTQMQSSGMNLNASVESNYALDW